MKNWIELISFIYPHEANFTKIKLESEGIEVWVKDELTAQVNNYLSNAIGGVKLFVREEDYEKARHILIESGKIKEGKTEPNKFIQWFDNFSVKIPIFCEWRLELRLIILFALLLLIIIAPIVVLFFPRV